MKSDVRSLKAEVKDSVSVEQVMVAVCDSITETTTITIRENEQGDTIKVVQVTERDRVRDRSAIRDVRERVEVRVVRDTVYIERRDSVRVQEFQGSSVQGAARASPVVSALKWVFWIIIAIGGLVIILKVSKVFKFFV